MIDTKYYCDDCKAEVAKSDDLLHVEVRISGMAQCSAHCLRNGDNAHDHHRTDIKTVHLCKATCAPKRNLAGFLALSRQ